MFIEVLELKTNPITKINADEPIQYELIEKFQPQVMDVKNELFFIFLIFSTYSRNAFLQLQFFGNFLGITSKFLNRFQNRKI